MNLFKDKFKITSNRFKDWNYSSEAVYFITIVTKERQCIFGSVEDGKMILNENGMIVENELLKSIKIRKNWFFHNWVVMPNHIHLLIEIQDISNGQIQNGKISHPEIIKTEITPTQITPAQIVETHRSASTSSISTPIDNANTKKMSTYCTETHSSASLRKNWDESNPDKSDKNPEITTTQITPTQIVETHRSASTPVTSTKIDNTNLQNFAETHSSASLQKKNDESNFSRKSNSISSFVAIFKSITTKQINGSESIWQQNYYDHVVRNYKRFETIYNYIKNNPQSWDTDSINTNFQ